VPSCQQKQQQKAAVAATRKKNSCSSNNKKVAVAASYNNNISCAVTKNHSIKIHFDSIVQIFHKFEQNKIKTS